MQGEAQALRVGRPKERAQAARQLEGRLKEPAALRAADAAADWGPLCLTVFKWAEHEALAAGWDPFPALPPPSPPPPPSPSTPSPPPPRATRRKICAQLRRAQRRG